MDENLIRTLHRTHIAVWNERDGSIREALMQTIYAENIEMYDKDFILQGFKEISGFIDKLHSQISQFNFTIPGSIQVVQNGLRTFWQIGTDQPPGKMSGMDFFILESGKVRHLYAFMD